MEMKHLWLVGLILVVRAIPSKPEDPLRKSNTKNAYRQKWQIFNANTGNERAIVKRDTDSSKRDIVASGSGCWRYCVKRKVDGLAEGKDFIKRVNIVWNVMDKAGMNLTQETSNDSFPGRNKNVQWESSTVSSENSNNFYDGHSDCELYIELGCETFDSTSISVTRDERLNFDTKVLAEKKNIVGSISEIFFVNEATENLRILAFGKVAQIVLEIPIARGNNLTDENRRKPRFSLSRTSEAEGLLIDARNPPSGEWRLNFSGIQRSNSTFSFTAFRSSRKYINGVNRNDDFDGSEMEPEVEASSRPRTAYPRIIRDNNSQRVIKSNGQENSVKYPEDPMEAFALSGTSVKTLISETREREFSEEANFQAETMDVGIDEKRSENNIEEKDNILDNSEVDKLSKIVTETRAKSESSVDLDPNTELFATTGSFHDVIFTVTNNQPLDIRHTFQGSSNPFRYIRVIPNESWIRPGQTIQVAVRIQVPNLEQPEPIIVTLRVFGTNVFEPVEKSTYVYTRHPDGRAMVDDKKPTIDYSFNDNCAGKIRHDRCSLSRWSVEVNVIDPDSGLKRVTSVPSGVTPRGEFISGTRNTVTFYYSATCCYTTVDVTAIDLLGNSETRTIDVTAWNNLSQGEIAAIVIGALFTLLLLIFIILMIIYCVRRRKSHDLSYSQRYGSRSPTSAERTNY